MFLSCLLTSFHLINEVHYFVCVSWISFCIELFYYSHQGLLYLFIARLSFWNLLRVTYLFISCLITCFTLPHQSTRSGACYQGTICVRILNLLFDHLLALLLLYLKYLLWLKSLIREHELWAQRVWLWEYHRRYAVHHLQIWLLPSLRILVNHLLRMLVLHRHHIRIMIRLRHGHRELHLLEISLILSRGH